MTPYLRLLAAMLLVAGPMACDGGVDSGATSEEDGAGGAQPPAPATPAPPPEAAPDPAPVDGEGGAGGGAPGDLADDEDDDSDRDRPWDREPDPYDLDFEIPRSEAFPPMLSAYGLYRAPMAALVPADDAHLLALSSVLFTDFAKKQRLMKLPAGTQIVLGADGRLVFPEGTVLSKTFYYPDDLRAPDGPRRVIETRLLVKTDGQWNVATYRWNAEQTDARLLLDGEITAATWIDAEGAPAGTDYAVPHEGECVTCHQANGEVAYIGPSLANLNRQVTRDGEPVDQLAWLQDLGVLAPGDWDAAPTLPDYEDATLPLAERARAYLEINCAHCHNPGGWDDGSDKRIDLRYTTPVSETNLARKARDLRRILPEGDMPYLGTTLIDEAGVQLILDYVSTL